MSISVTDIESDVLPTVGNDDVEDTSVPVPGNTSTFPIAPVPGSTDEEPASSITLWEIYVDFERRQREEADKKAGENQNADQTYYFDSGDVDDVSSVFLEGDTTADEREEEAGEEDSSPQKFNFSGNEGPEELLDIRAAPHASGSFRHLLPVVF